MFGDNGYCFMGKNLKGNGRVAQWTNGSWHGNGSIEMVPCTHCYIDRVAIHPLFGGHVLLFGKK